MPLNCLEKIFTERGVCVIADIVKTRQEKTNNKRGIGNRGKTKIVVKEHFSEKGKTMEELLTDVMLEKAKQKGVTILLPTDVVCADAFANDANTVMCGVDAIPDSMMGLDIGEETTKAYAEAIAGAKTVFWNGPMGVFEMSSFEAGTKGVALAVAANKEAATIIGGGDSVAAVNKFGLADQMTFISTGGGASMELVQGEALPGVEALK